MAKSRGAKASYLKLEQKAQHRLQESGPGFQALGPSDPLPPRPRRLERAAAAGAEWEETAAAAACAEAAAAD